MKQWVRELKPNGKLPVRMGWQGAFQGFDIVGGPYDAFRHTPNSYGVCVRAEGIHDVHLDLLLAIPDFSVPDQSPDHVREVLRRTLQAALEGKEVYVGCMGGWGRTGLFLALLAKATGERDPVAYVRKHYSPRAVETVAQARYVASFDVSEVQVWFVRTAWRKWWMDRVFWWAH